MTRRSAGRRVAPALASLIAGCAAAGAPGGAPGGSADGVVGDAMPAALTATPGDAARGRAIVASRREGLCLLCHRAPIPEERFQGDLAPDLAGVGMRLGAGQLRLRLVDSRRIDPASIMPAYHRSEGRTRVAAAWAARPLLEAQQVEDVVAYLLTLRGGAQ